MTNHSEFMRRYGYLATKHYGKKYAMTVLWTIASIILFVCISALIFYTDQERMNYQTAWQADNELEQIMFYNEMRRDAEKLVK